MKRGLSVRKPDAKELISFFHGFKRPIWTLNLGLGYIDNIKLINIFHNVSQLFHIMTCNILLPMNNYNTQ